MKSQSHGKSPGVASISALLSKNCYLSNFEINCKQKMAPRLENRKMANSANYSIHGNFIMCYKMCKKSWTVQCHERKLELDNDIQRTRFNNHCQIPKPNNRGMKETNAMAWLISLTFERSGLHIVAWMNDRKSKSTLSPIFGKKHTLVSGVSCRVSTSQQVKRSTKTWSWKIRLSSGENSIDNEDKWRSYIILDVTMLKLSSTLVPYVWRSP